MFYSGETFFNKGGSLEVGCSQVSGSKTSKEPTQCVKLVHVCVSNFSDKEN